MNYKRVYDKIISDAKVNRTIEYSEKHHIIPRCIGGLDATDNLVILSAREHFLCHWLLTKIYANNPKLMCAWNGMCMIGKGQDKRKINSHLFKYAREAFSYSVSMKEVSTETRKKMSKTRKGRKRSTEEVIKFLAGENNPFYGKSHSKETIIKLKNKVFSTETKNKMSKNHTNVEGKNNPMYGKNHSCETRLKISNSCTIGWFCNHCKREFGKSAFTKYHGENCKLKEGR